ncbi:DUF488 family protein [Sphingomonas sp. NCPPB 2930]
MHGLLTIGYEGASLQDFIETLKGASVNTLLDVRELPLSRRKGFSKRALAEALEAHGIAYRHERDLGSPKAIRHQLHDDQDYEQFFNAFTDYLKSQRPLLNRLASELTGCVALMCFERDPTTCHRSIVAKQLASLTKLNTRHLGVKDGIAGQRTCAGASEGISAA